MPLCSVGWGANFTAGRGTCLGGRPSTEIGNFGNLHSGTLSVHSAVRRRELYGGRPRAFCELV